jgi:hypothetical protein
MRKSTQVERSGLAGLSNLPAQGAHSPLLFVLLFDLRIADTERGIAITSITHASSARSLAWGPNRGNSINSPMDHETLATLKNLLTVMEDEISNRGMWDDLQTVWKWINEEETKSAN